MKSAHIFALAVVVGFSSVAGSVRAADTYTIDAVHSSFIFRIKHINTSFLYGRINASSGTLVVDEADPTKSSIDLELKADSVDTVNEKRDQHLKGPDFFNAKQFPSITFKSKSVKKTGDDFEVTGDFTLLGVTKELTAKLAQTGGGGGAKSPFGDFRIGYEGTFTFKRSDFGMKAMLAAIGDDIQVTVSVEAAHK